MEEPHLGSLHAFPRSVHLTLLEHDCQLPAELPPQSLQRDASRPADSRHAHSLFSGPRAVCSPGSLPRSLRECPTLHIQYLKEISSWGVSHLICSMSCGLDYHASHGHPQLLLPAALSLVLAIALKCSYPHVSFHSIRSLTNLSLPVHGTGHYKHGSYNT
jgi:hypothetical protein